MTKKELIVIRRCICSAQEAIEQLACENYPYSKFCDSDFRDMFYSLNSMAISLTSKIDAMC